MKKYLVLFFVFLSIYLIADIHKERIYDNSDYFSLMNKYDINYSYSMNEGMPVMPAKPAMLNCIIASPSAQWAS